MSSRTVMDNDVSDISIAGHIQLLPRLIRLRDAPAYLGMDRNRFNSEVRPKITEIPIGKQGIAFDRLDLDTWVLQYKASRGCPEVANQERKAKWDKNVHRASLNEVNIGILKNKSLDNAFEKVLELSHSKRQNNTSPGESKT